MAPPSSGYNLLPRQALRLCRALSGCLPSKRKQKHFPANIWGKDLFCILDFPHVCCLPSCLHVPCILSMCSVCAEHEGEALRQMSTHSFNPFEHPFIYPSSTHILTHPPIIHLLTIHQSIYHHLSIRLPSKHPPTTHLSITHLFIIHPSTTVYVPTHPLSYPFIHPQIIHLGTIYPFTHYPHAYHHIFTIYLSTWCTTINLPTSYSCPFIY